MAPADKMPHISVTYNPINQSNTFTSGDFISGQVILDVAKDTQMQSLSVKIKGKAEVSWSEHYGKTTVVYSDKEKYYSVKRFLFGKTKHMVGEITAVTGFALKLEETRAI